MTEEWPECVFYEDVKCKVRYEMERSKTLRSMVQQIKKDDDSFQEYISSTMKALEQFLSINWTALAGFCSICPKKRDKDL